MPSGLLFAKQDFLGLRYANGPPVDVKFEQLEGDSSHHAIGIEDVSQDGLQFLNRGWKLTLMLDGINMQCQTQMFLRVDGPNGNGVGRLHGFDEVFRLHLRGHPGIRCRRRSVPGISRGLPKLGHLTAQTQQFVHLPSDQFRECPFVPLPGVARE